MSGRNATNSLLDLGLSRQASSTQVRQAASKSFLPGPDRRSRDSCIPPLRGGRYGPDQRVPADCRQRAGSGYTGSAFSGHFPALYHSSLRCQLWRQFDETFTVESSRWKKMAIRVFGATGCFIGCKGFPGPVKAPDILAGQVQFLIAYATLQEPFGARSGQHQCRP